MSIGKITLIRSLYFLLENLSVYISETSQGSFQVFIIDHELLQEQWDKYVLHFSP